MNTLRLMTPSEAIGKTCPILSRHAALYECGASQCMAWRFNTADGRPLRRMRVVEYRIEDGAAIEPAQRPDDVPSTWAWDDSGHEAGDACGYVEPECDAGENTLGYCSLICSPFARVGGG